MNDINGAASSKALPDCSTEGSTTAGAILATLGAVFTAVMGSACCWLPLVLIALGFSAAGVGNFLDHYRPYFLMTAFALLGVAWYLAFPAFLRHHWAYLTGRASSPPAVEACCNTNPLPVPPCCGTGLVPENNGCWADSTEANPDRSARRRLGLQRATRLCLGLTSAMVLLFALFPHWFGAMLAGGRSDATAGINLDDHQRLVLAVEGMMEECCATIVETALRRVPGVSSISVNHGTGHVAVFLAPDREVPREAILQAIRTAGYDVHVIMEPTPCPPDSRNGR